MAFNVVLGTAVRPPSAVCCVDMDGEAASHLFQIVFVIAGIKPWDIAAEFTECARCAATAFSPQ